MAMPMQPVAGMDPEFVAMMSEGGSFKSMAPVMMGPVGISIETQCPRIVHSVLSNHGQALWMLPY